MQPAILILLKLLQQMIWLDIFMHNVVFKIHQGENIVKIEKCIS